MHYARIRKERHLRCLRLLCVYVRLRASVRVWRLLRGSVTAALLQFCPACHRAFEPGVRPTRVSALTWITCRRCDSWRGPLYFIIGFFGR